MPRTAKKMTTKKRTAKKAVAVKPVIETVPALSQESKTVFPPFAGPEKKENMTSFWIGSIVVALVVIGAFAFKNGWIVAATVDNTPIFTWQVTSALMSQYGKTTLDSMVTERMIESEQLKQGISVSKEDIEKRESDMLAEFGGSANLDDILAAQGMNRSDFDRQVSLQIGIEKLLSKGFSVTDDEIAMYLSTNSAQFTATDEAGLKIEARQALENQYINKTFQSWFTGLKEKTKVVRFIN